ncbi:MAG: hypothetical protein N2691_05925 [Patescibacteria group bacterium]|nr:hypothetical protein [Patescibacteria group bacterium]
MKKIRIVLGILALVLLVILIGLMLRLAEKRAGKQLPDGTGARPVAKQPSATRIPPQITERKIIVTGPITPAVQQPSPLPTVERSKPIEVVVIGSTTDTQQNRKIPAGSLLRIVNATDAVITITESMVGISATISPGEFSEVPMESPGDYLFTITGNPQLKITVN